MVVTTVATPTRSNSAVKPSNPNSHFAHATPNGRQDVLALKQQLADALGENGPLYWDSLREFITGKLNRQEFDYFAHQYVKKNNAHLHNAFILATIHNALSDAPPPLKQRAIGWAKRKRGKDGSYRTAAGQGRDPKRLKMDVMSLSRVDREKLKLLLKLQELASLQPFPSPQNNYPASKELPSADGLRPRMTTIAYESGLMGGVNEEVLEAMALALEIHIKSVISTTISKIRVNRTLGPKCANIRNVIRKEAQSLSSQNADAAVGSPGPSSPVNNGFALASPAPVTSQTTKSSISDKPFIATKDLAFAFDLSPYILVETPLSAERVTTLIGDSEDEEDEYDDTDDELESDEGEFEI
ncbi:hypothetical protein K450DRAFT_200858 [Umbelopsis ramanniana AG]|uniref:Transcriptional regulator of RNA polII, SAGA, subunit-domain-containing protein n=1 Tax=Umbelopsis ramanniana AG TaxID=1314678 RepID=A0AAD5E7P9_UMBRA|nr:uncharacterized protein K450DRAFT_200858 [Umbelopsis ramanniana AG]KAI8577811.1 hypothetical protein K450DRAFT_200858 [Umbelopsis ramanniana AG]